MNDMFKVSNGDMFTGWIATDIDERLRVYAAHTRSFHHVPAVETAVFFGCDLTLEPVNEQEALDEIAHGAGRLEGNAHAEFRAKLAADTDRVPLAEVIPSADKRRPIREQASE